MTWRKVFAVVMDPTFLRETVLHRNQNFNLTISYRRSRKVQFSSFELVQIYGFSRSISPLPTTLSTILLNYYFILVVPTFFNLILSIYLPLGESHISSFFLSILVWRSLTPNLPLYHEKSSSIFSRYSELYVI